MKLSILEFLVYQPYWVLLLSFFGVLTTSKLVVSVLHWLYAVFLRPPKNLLHYGKWAVVTGSTDGIGKALAFELSRRGLNLILVGRNIHKLNEVSASIQTESPNVEVKSVIVDFCNDLFGGIRRLDDTIRDLDVGLLVNNAGVTYDYGTYFHEDIELWWRNIMKVNAEGFTAVTSAVLPLMISKKKGAVMNIGSGASTVIPAHPLFSVYAATKAYVFSLSKSLNVEYKKSGIDVQCQIPLYVATKMVAFKKSSFFSPSPMIYSRYAADCIGTERQCMPYWPHTLQSCCVKLLPTFLINKWRLAYGLSRRRQKDSM